ncbi:MAG: exodeoxyribonuclease VII large subunit [Deltaproteobacteria bacterium]|nr:exodeoxyribonuclease VII large subunit [Deltaproteobacteria bacterium]
MRNRKGHSILSLFDDAGSSSSDRSPDESPTTGVGSSVKKTSELEKASGNERPNDAAQRRQELLQKKENAPKTVSQVLNIARMALSRAFGRVRVEGEVSDFKIWGQLGHWFFSLKDEQQTLSCFMRNRDAERVQQAVEIGMQIVVTGRMEVAKGRSQMQLVVDKIEFAGQGRLAITFERLRQEMKNLGWFDAEYKKEIPILPRRVGVVTSKEGAALHDVCKVLRERLPGVDILVAPTRVQGDKASVEIAAAIERLDQSGRCDVLVVTRGGGGAEDLFAFNMRSVCQAVWQCTTPVIAGVGHQSDTTLVELVADKRAATPSHASQLAVPDLRELEASLQAFERRMRGALEKNLRRQERSLQKIRLQLPSPRKNLARAQQDLDGLKSAFSLVIQQKREECDVELAELEQRLVHASPRHQVAEKSRQLREAQTRLLQAAPHAELQAAGATLAHRRDQLRQGVKKLQDQRWERLHVAISRLHALSPLAVLDRGYALLRDEQGGVVREAKALRVGQEATVLLQDGSAAVEVKSLHLKSEAE